MPRLLRPLLLLLTLLSAPVFADGQYLVEVLVFRQSAQQLNTNPVPEDWNAGSTLLKRDQERTALFDTEIERMKQSQRYQILARKAWAQQIGTTPTAVSFSEGPLKDGHGVVDGMVTLRQDGFIEASFKGWINQFDANGFLAGSEMLQQKRRLLPGKVTYIDHPNLGALIRVSPL